MGSNNKESDTHVDAYSDQYRDAGSIPAASNKEGKNSSEIDQIKKKLAGGLERILTILRLFCHCQGARTGRFPLNLDTPGEKNRDSCPVRTLQKCDRLNRVCNFGDIDNFPESVTIIVPLAHPIDAFFMTGPDIREAVINILSDIAPDEDFASIKDDVPFREQFEMDSMDMLDIILELRKRYRVQIPEEDYPKLGDMNSTVEYLLPLMDTSKNTEKQN